MGKIVLILDHLKYRNYEKKYTIALLKRFEDAKIIYTEYEDDLIRKVRSWRYSGSIFQHILYWYKSYKYAKEILLESTDTVICINPIVGIFLGLLNRRKKFELILCGFLFEEKKNKLYYWMRKKVVELSLKGTSSVIVYAKQEVEYYKTIFQGNNKFKFIPYGIDYLDEEEYDGFLPKEYIFSGGGSNRDYKTLVEGYDILKEKQRDYPLYIATLPHCLDGLDTKNITVLTDVVLENFGDIMKKSLFIVLSLKDTEISVGHQVMLQALKNNMIILVNRIKAVENYVDENHVIFYESENIYDLSNKMEFIIENYWTLKKKFENNLEYYDKNYTFINLLERLIELAFNNSVERN